MTISNFAQALATFVLKGLAKLGNIVAETLLRTQMFPSLAARETYVAETFLFPGHKFCVRNICFPV